jgi:exodeoxyribonuclease VII large subunit
LNPDAVREEVVTVGELTAGIRRLLEEHFYRLWVEGEVSNYKRHSSGHRYFTLKDASAQVRCVMFRSDARTLRFEPADGMQVQAGGRVSVYEARGEYQLVVRRMRSAGEGALRSAFEAVKRKLAAEGLFDADRKKPIPPVPSSIGLVTSGDGAALRDILTVLERRYAGVRVILCSTAVQGPGAASEIATAIGLFNRHASRNTGQRVDVLIVGRGGGSEEDLWSFNEEIVARAIAASDIPIISAVGHETDVSIADLAADLRAPTPSAAAEAAVPDGAAIARRVAEQRNRLRMMTYRLLTDRKTHVLRLLRSRGLDQPRLRVQMISQRVDELTTRSRMTIQHKVQSLKTSTEALQSRLVSLDPSGPLERGFVLVERRGLPVTRSAQLGADDEIELIFKDGRRGARVVD